MNTPEPRPFEGVSLPDASRVDGLCDDFEKSWRQGRRPRLESILESVRDLAARGVLFRELLALEVVLRFNAGEKPDPGDYLPRFPSRAGVIHQVFDEEWTRCIDADEDRPPLGRR